MLNCMTYALDIEDQCLEDIDSFLYSRFPEKAIQEKCKKFGRNCRLLKSDNDELYDGEWVIAFYGFIPTHRDYEGLPDQWDYHFMRKVADIWIHRPYIGATEIAVVPEETRNAFIKEGYPPLFFAISKVEE